MERQVTGGRNAVVVGAGGALGAALTDALARRPDVARVFALSSRRAGDAATAAGTAAVTRLQADARDRASLAEAADRVADAVGEVHLLIVCTGILHGDSGLQPEKRLADLEPGPFTEVMVVNALAPLLAIEAFAPLFSRRERAVAAALSAMVGSIGDNRLGGWYSYRMSKAALNMGLRNAAIELGRLPGRSGGAPIVIAIHPGTTHTPLSAPFLRRRDAREPEDSARHVLAVLDGLGEEDSGGFFNWNGERLPW